MNPPRSLEQKEFKDLPSVTVEEVQTMLAAGTPIQLVDTRPRHYSTKSHDMIAGAVWRDPEHVTDWIGTLSKSEPVIVFCVYGFTSDARPPDLAHRRIRCTVHVRRTLRMEGDQWAGQIV